MPRIHNVGVVKPMVTALLNVVTFETARTLKIFFNRTVRWGLSLVSIQSSVYGATTVAKVSQFSNNIRSSVSFYSRYA